MSLYITTHKEFVFFGRTNRIIFDLNMQLKKTRAGEKTPEWWMGTWCDIYFIFNPFRDNSRNLKYVTISEMCECVSTIKRSNLKPLCYFWINEVKCLITIKKNLDTKTSCARDLNSWKLCAVEKFRYCKVAHMGAS